MATPYRLCLCQLARVVASPQLLWGPAEAPELYSLPRLRLALALLTELLQGGEAQERSLAQLLDRLRDALGARDGGAAGQASSLPSPSRAAHAARSCSASGSQASSWTW